MSQLLNHADVICAAASRALTSTFGMCQVVNCDDDGNILGISRVERCKYLELVDERIIALYEPWLRKVYFDSADSLIPTKALELYMRDARQLRDSGIFSATVENRLQLVRERFEQIGNMVFPTPTIHPDDYLVLKNLEGARTVTSAERKEIEREDYRHHLWWHLIADYSDNLRPRLIQELHALNDSSVRELNSRFRTIRGELNFLASNEQLDSWLTWQPVLELPAQATGRNTTVTTVKSRGIYTNADKEAILESWEKAKGANILKASFVADYAKKISRRLSFVKALLNAAQTDQRR